MPIEFSINVKDTALIESVRSSSKKMSEEKKNRIDNNVVPHTKKEFRVVNTSKKFRGCAYLSCVSRGAREAKSPHYILRIPTVTKRKCMTDVLSVTVRG